MNACTFCKHGKRKCDKGRPFCSNCVRLRRHCVYIEDTIQTHFAVRPRSGQPPPEFPTIPASVTLPDINFYNPERLRLYAVETALRFLGAPENVQAMSTTFFTGTHQRIPALSKTRFYQNLPSLIAGQPRPDFAVLCLCMLLVQQLPSEMAGVHPSLYGTAKTLISVLEVTNELSIDYAHCRILLTFYDMGHGHHTSAYVSIASCARTARVLGLHRTMRSNIRTDSSLMVLEEERRAWWSIMIMDRFINLCNGDDLFVTDDPERTDSLPIDDLLWAEGTTAADTEDAINSAPSLDTPFNITVGQMARECQISNLAGKVIRHVFKPTPDPQFNAKEAIQLERTLRAYLPLLAAEELRTGKYCAAFGICNSALYILYEFMLDHDNLAEDERRRLLQSIEEISLGAITFAEASYGDLEGNYPPQIFSPYLPFSLFQTAIVQHRLWKNSEDSTHKRHLNSVKNILGDCARRWKIAEQYIKIIENLDEGWPSLAFPHQGSAISAGKSRA